MAQNRVIGYCRVSTAKQEHETSTLFNQQQIVEQFANVKQLPFEVYSEQKPGNIPPQHRPQLTLALNALKPGDIFFAKSRDRLSRDPIITNYIIGIITLEKRAKLVCGDDVESQDFITKLCHDFISDISAHQYRESISKKVIASMDMRRRIVKQWCSYIPYGFVIDSQRNLFISARQQDVIENIKTLRNEGYTPFKICKSLNSNGVPRPHYNKKSTGVWTQGSIRRILSFDNDELKRDILVKHGEAAIKDVDVSLSQIDV